jgi:hypothetical protein
MKMADIYTMDGEVITQGLQSDSVCSEAIQAAKSIAAERNEVVRLEDGDDVYDVYPDGTVSEGEAWPECEC